jgi:hypothetical protein
MVMVGFASRQRYPGNGRERDSARTGPSGKRNSWVFRVSFRHVWLQSRSWFGYGHGRVSHVGRLPTGLQKRPRMNLPVLSRLGISPQVHPLIRRFRVIKDELLGCFEIVLKHKLDRLLREMVHTPREKVDNQVLGSKKRD